MKETLILKTIVGSQANGLADKDSDTDYRGVFVTPTSEILKLGGKYKSNSFIQGNTDETTYEIGHFLHLAVHCNPSILEVFKAPIVFEQQIGSVLQENFGMGIQDLFPYVWNPKGVYDAFCGYSKNQETKMLDNKTEYDRIGKFACAYLRTLYNLECLLKTETFTLDVTHNPDLYKRLKEIRKGNFTKGDVINEAEQRKKKCADLLNKCNHKPDLDKVNEFLLKVRRDFW